MSKKHTTRLAEKRPRAVRNSMPDSRHSRLPAEQTHPAIPLAKTMSSPLSDLSPDDILALQRATGNRAVTRTLSASISSLIQRQNIAEKDGDKETLVQRRYVGDAADAISIEPVLEQRIEGSRGSGHPLPDGLRRPMERALGSDLGHVRLHTDGESDRLTRSLQARAFTTGPDLFFKRGEYDPHSHAGRRLIAHELIHVVQQQGRSIQGNHRTDKIPSSEGSTRPSAAAGIHRVHSSNVIQRATSLDGPVDDAYVGRLLDESQGRKSGTGSPEGHPLDHLCEGVITKKRGAFGINNRVLGPKSRELAARKITTLYSAKADMKAVLKEFLTNDTVQAQIAGMKAPGGGNSYSEDFKHTGLKVALANWSTSTVLPANASLSFLMIQKTTEATPNLHLQTMYPKAT